MESFKIEEKYSYDDILMVPGYSDIFPDATNLRTRLAGDIYLNVPILSAAMDTVTEKEMAIALALEGGSGVIHRSLTPEAQSKQVNDVKRYLNWIIENPVTVKSGTSASDIKKIMKERGVTGLPVINAAGKVCGIVTARDIKFCSDFSGTVDDIMTKNVITVEVNPTVEEAKAKFNTHKIEKLPIVDKNGVLTGLITVTDLDQNEKHPNASVDGHGSLIVGAAISNRDYDERIPLLKKAKCDFVVLDRASGMNKEDLQAIRNIKKRYDIPVIGGNTADGEGTELLIKAGSDAVKVGVGPGSICTTRVIAGVGMPQFSAVYESAMVAKKYNIPIVADGGIKFSGDLVKAIGGGASTVMIGNLFAGLKESPGAEIIYEGRIFKQYRGMGSLGALKEGSGDRYQMKAGDAAVPEGIEGRVPFKGDLQPYLHQLTTGIRKGMAYCGCRTIEEFHKYRKFVKITGAGLKESHVHDVNITQEAPNYSKF